LTGVTWNCPGIGGPLVDTAADANVEPQLKMNVKLDLGGKEFDSNLKLKEIAFSLDEKY
jgi:hypothetical protein